MAMLQKIWIAFRLNYPHFNTEVKCGIPEEERRHPSVCQTDASKVRTLSVWCQFRSLMDYGQLAATTKQLTKIKYIMNLPLKATKSTTRIIREYMTSI